MKMDICGFHDETSHASKPSNNTTAVKLEEIPLGECSNQ